MAGARVDAWFEYVRTDANVADAPSREDMSSVIYELGARPSEAVAGLVDSRPVPAVVPEPGDWDGDAASWVLRARRAP